ncbi:MAG: TIGR03364 family FAD-dependent oxidoreductase [Rhizobiaceae bacterium]|nr:TIGR03364 family FAD-dependent oxidoreductase [Rhizobiaceae bacterium]
MAFDLAVVGAGIIGLAHALAAARRGLRVVVIDRDAAANGASIRNFGLVVVSGQQPGAARAHAMRTRDIWIELAEQAGIDILQQGKVVVAQRAEAMDLLEAFKSFPEQEHCRLLTAAEAASRVEGLNAAQLAGGMYSPHELRVESRHAVPRLAAFLEERHGVVFRRGVCVTAVTQGMVETSHGPYHAEKVVVCPGDDLTTLFPEQIAARKVQRCKLQMLRLADPGHRIKSAVISDLSLLRYEAYAMLPQAMPLRRRLEAECAEALANGVHLIVTQSADGSLVVGDSHHYAATPDPFGSERIDELILGEFSKLFGRAPKVIARWVGTYSWCADHAYFADAPAPDTRLVMVTGGTGASTCFSIGEETVSGLFGA